MLVAAVATEVLYLGENQFLNTANTAVPNDLVITISSTEQTNTVQLKGPSSPTVDFPASLTLLDNKSVILTRCPLKTVSVCITSELIGKVSYWSRNVGATIPAGAESTSKLLNEKAVTNSNLICYVPSTVNPSTTKTNAGVAGQAGSLNYSCDVVLPVSLNQSVSFTAKSQAFSTGIISPDVSGGQVQRESEIIRVQYISATFQLEGTITKTGSNTYSVNVVQSIPQVIPSA